jgi:hypothetical protein
MTFVIKDNFDKIGFISKEFEFDVDGYDYILNCNNIFTEGNLVRNQFEKVQFILKNYEEIDPSLLESLHFKNSKGQMPLHLAIESKNTRMINLIIEYMSKIEYASMHHFTDILRKLVTFHMFEEYLNHAPFQTVQMFNH